MTVNSNPSPVRAEPEMPAVSAEAGNDLLRRVKKGIRTLIQRGPHCFLNDAVYSFYYHRNQRRESRLRMESVNPQTSINLWGRPFELHPSLAGINEELRRFATHEPLATSVYQRYLREGDHIIDVGANVGYYLFAAAQVVGKSGRFLVFEPLPSNYAVLEKNIRALDSVRCKIEARQWAIGNSCGSIKFYESELPNWGSLIPSGELAQLREIPVEVRRLDDVVEGQSGFQPTVIRMDVEGAEVLVLAGARNLIARHKPMLFIEVHGFAITREQATNMLEEFQKIGYNEGVLIDRVWDQPWIHQWIRAFFRWSGDLHSLKRRILSRPRESGTFTLILKRPGG